MLRLLFFPLLPLPAATPPRCLVHVCSSSSSSSPSSSRSLARVAILFSRVRPLFLAVLENPPVLFPGLGNEVREAIAYERVTPLARIYSYAWLYEKYRAESVTAKKPAPKRVAIFDFSPRPLERGRVASSRTRLPKNLLTFSTTPRLHYYFVPLSDHHLSPPPLQLSSVFERWEISRRGGEGEQRGVTENIQFDMFRGEWREWLGGKFILRIV